MFIFSRKLYGFRLLSTGLWSLLPLLLTGEQALAHIAIQSSSPKSLALHKVSSKTLLAKVTSSGPATSKKSRRSKGNSAQKALQVKQLATRIPCKPHPKEPRRYSRRHYYRLGKLWLKQRLYTDAVRSFTKAICLTPKGWLHFGTHYYLALAYYKMNRHKKALEAINAARYRIKKKVHRAYYGKLRYRIEQLYQKNERLRRKQR